MVTLGTCITGRDVNGNQVTGHVRAIKYYSNKIVSVTIETANGRYIEIKELNKDE